MTRIIGGDRVVKKEKDFKYYEVFTPSEYSEFLFQSSSWKNKNLRNW